MMSSRGEYYCNDVLVAAVTSRRESSCWDDIPVSAVTSRQKCATAAVMILIVTMTSMQEQCSCYDVFLIDSMTA